MTTAIAANPLVDVLSRLDGVRETGAGQYQAKCPGHDDRKASLCIGRGDDGRVLLKCQAGCQTIHVAAKLGINMADLFVAKHKSGNGQAKPARASRAPLGPIVAAYDYFGPDGDLRFQAVRHEPKDFRQRRPDGNGGWIGDLKGVERVLYRLPDLNDADLDAPVFIVEGEKDVDRLWSLGLVATCNPMGAGKWIDTYSETLRGRVAVIIPDNDQAGHDHAQHVAQSLQGKAAAVRVIELPGLPPKGDVSDWLDAGGAAADELLRLAEAAPAWVQPFAKPTAEDVATSSASSTRMPGNPTDEGNGRRFAHLQEGRALYCHPLGCWFVQDGRRWKTAAPGAPFRRG